MDFRCPLLKLLKAAGWELVRHGDRHDVFQNPEHPGSLTVPRKLADRNLGNRLLKIAGVRHRKL
jgi:predicted RNA binding protein YcfA (HicA-like mRNA interferase family)